MESLTYDSYLKEKHADIKHLIHLLFQKTVWHRAVLFQRLFEMKPGTNEEIEETILTAIDLELLSEEKQVHEYKRLNTGCVKKSVQIVYRALIKSCHYCEASLQSQIHFQCIQCNSTSHLDCALQHQRCGKCRCSHDLAFAKNRMVIEAAEKVKKANEERENTDRYRLRTAVSNVPNELIDGYIYRLFSHLRLLKDNDSGKKFKLSVALQFLHDIGCPKDQKRPVIEKLVALKLIDIDGPIANTTTINSIAGMDQVYPQCDICAKLSLFGDSLYCDNMNCAGTFCRTCLTKWVGDLDQHQPHKTCPVCRSALKNTREAIRIFTEEEIAIQSAKNPQQRIEPQIPKRNTTLFCEEDWIQQFIRTYGPRFCTCDESDEFQPPRRNRSAAYRCRSSTSCGRIIWPYWRWPNRPDI